MTEDTEQKSKITLGLITSWGLGGLFLLVGIVTIFDGEHNIAIALCFLLMAGLLLPPVRQFTYGKTDKSLSTGLRVVLIIVIFAVAASMMPTVSADYSSSIVADASPQVSDSSAQDAPKQEQRRISSVPDHVKDEIMQRCEIDMSEYGAMMIKGCVDQDIKAYKAIQNYPSGYENLIARCKADMAEYGWVMVKGCTDQDIKAQKALSDY